MVVKILKAVLCTLLFLPFFSVSQQVAAVNFAVQVPAGSDGDVYIAGSFNYWHAGDSLYKMKKMDNGVYSITLPLFDGKNYQYKYTSGNWDKVEIALNDSNIKNRNLYSSNGKNISDTVVKWKKPKIEEKKTISPQMQKINAMKDTAAAKLQLQLNDMLGLLKSYMENLLQENPSKKAFRRMNKQAMDKLENIYNGLADLFWNIFASLSPDQKKKILQAIQQQDSKDVLNTFSKALDETVNDTKPAK